MESIIIFSRYTQVCGHVLELVLVGVAGVVRGVGGPRRGHQAVKVVHHALYRLVRVDEPINVFENLLSKTKIGLCLIQLFFSLVQIINGCLKNK